MFIFTIIFTSIEKLATAPKREPTCAHLKINTQQMHGVYYRAEVTSNPGSVEEKVMKYIGSTSRGLKNKEGQTRT